MKLRYINIILIALIVTITSACKKSQVFDNPYAGGTPPLGVQLSLIVAPTPQQGAPGTTVTFAATGLLPYKDKLVFMFNGTQAEIVSVTDAAITVKVPVNASTGITTLVIGDQLFFGPRFKVLGKISVDPAFTVLNGANNSVNNAYQYNDGRFLMVGSFTDYDTKAIIGKINHIVRTFQNGPADISFAPGAGSDGPLNSIIATTTNYFVAGSFGGYFFNNGKSTLTNISNITRLNLNGFADSVIVPSYTNTGKKKAVPAFNGGTDGAISKIFNSQGKVLAIGSFKYYQHRRYDLLINPLVFDTVQIPQVVRFNTDGTLDQTYRYSPALGRGLPGGNGSVNDGFLQQDGKLVLVGNFNKFDSLAAVRIVRLNTDGTVDPTFNTGSGADRAIYSVTYNAASNRYLIAGAFTTYNGQPANGIAMLKTDGTLDNSFISKGFTIQGLPNFAKQLSNGLIVVSGSFVTYNNVRRPGLMVLTPTGDLATDYNCLGDFTGSLRDIFETTNSSGKITVMLMGNFSQVDGLSVKNISRLVLEP